MLSAMSLTGPSPLRVAAIRYLARPDLASATPLTDRAIRSWPERQPDTCSSILSGPWLAVWFAASTSSSADTVGPFAWSPPQPARHATAATSAEVLPLMHRLYPLTSVQCRQNASADPTGSA